ncbi:helicase-related protein [Flavobacterium sp.]|uniref:helicase-related protein n=1 Tax=Flavobacterium sp. TaxID=239 RepID=UPI003B9B374B
MANNFITNNKTNKSLKGRLNTLIGISDELKFLVGFFYFSGWQELFENLKKNENLTLKLLVGLQVDQILNKIVEHGSQEEEQSQDDLFNQFMTSMGNAINNEEMDTEAFYNQVEFFLQMLNEKRLIIRKTENSNHAKLYLFRLNQEQAEIQAMIGQFITGSSNLTRAGLSGQEEFNVEIKDYGFTEAENYFDELWERAIPISEIENRKEFLIQFIQHKSQAASVTPFEAYVLILKTYLDLQQQKQIKPEVENLLEEIGYKKYSYQTDAVNQALSIIEEYNGVIIADVVGLGKSVIASLIAKNLGKRGMVICPPGLMGDKTYNTGWWGYINEFKLYDWEVESRGKLEDLADTIQTKGIKVVIVDEAHYFRNQDSADYESLLTICRDRTVILLTATPFNNSPADIFSLLKLFIVPGKSGITIDDNLEGLFRAFNYKYKRLSDIIKNWNSNKPAKRQKAETLYRTMLAKELPIDVNVVRHETKLLANQIKSIISSVVIRRNRLDLKEDYVYKAEVGDLSTVKDPVELFYHLSHEQNTFYDRILNEYFEENGRFKGAIYQPFSYEKIVDEDQLDEQGNRQFQQQQNLFDFMRRLLVKRFESSFGAFSQSIDRFLQVHILVRDFIEKSNGKYILDRGLIDKIKSYDEDDIDRILSEYSKDLLNKKVPKNNTVYDINDFQRRTEFLEHIESDILVFQEIQSQLKKLKIVENDPKRERIANEIQSILEKDKNRKVILFSEYVDTIKHLEPYFREKFGMRLLVCDGKVSKELAKSLNSDFNAQRKDGQTNHFDILLTSDKLSEGFNLNRAGVIINYDIPWNPTRVIQRVGRINRIGAKVFDELHIYNFFPSEIGADIVKSREIAAQKMYLIHSSLGEDAKIFDEEEEPTASGLYFKLNQNPDESGGINTSTHIRNIYNEIETQYPELIKKISNLPTRVKSAKKTDNYQLNVLRKKGLSLFAQIIEKEEEGYTNIKEVTFDDLLLNTQCEFNEIKLPLSKDFWINYEKIKSFKPNYKIGRSDIALEAKALENLNVYLKILSGSEESLAKFVRMLIKDIKKYHTLSVRTLGRLGRKKIDFHSSEKEVKAFTSEINWIRNHFGDDYLDTILTKINNQKNEVIIAVENHSNT